MALVAQAQSKFEKLNCLIYEPPFILKVIYYSLMILLHSSFLLKSHDILLE